MAVRGGYYLQYRVNGANRVIEEVFIDPMDDGFLELGAMEVAKNKLADIEKKTQFHIDQAFLIYKTPIKT